MKTFIILISKITPEDFESGNRPSLGLPTNGISYDGSIMEDEEGEAIVTIKKEMPRK
jgi:hypothetical protein